MEVIEKVKEIEEKWNRKAEYSGVRISSFTDMGGFKYADLLTWV